MTATKSVTDSSSVRILIVEDEGLIALDLQERLCHLGYRIAGIARGGAEAIAVATAEEPDLVLMDIKLEGEMDGVTAATRIREHLHLPVIYITSYTDETTLERAKLAEPLGYIVKPFTDEELHRCIEIARYRHAAERRVEEQREWLDLVLHSMAEAVVATDEMGRIRLLNPTAEQLLGWTEAEARGHLFTEVVRFTDPDSPVMADPIGLALHARIPVQGGRFQLQARNREDCLVEVSTSTIGKGGSVSGGILVFRNITQRLQVEQELQLARRMDSLGRLAGGIAHEFNNLLTVILGVSSAGIADATASDAQQGRFGLIAQAAEKAGTLTRKLLALGRKQVLSPRPVDVNVLLHDMYHMMRTVLRESVDIQIEAHASQSWVMADRQQLEDAVLNIFLNARDAVADGGRVEIRTDNALLPDGAGGTKGGEAVRIAISDNGAGMSPEVIARIFEPFFTTKVESRGSGLGLASAHGFISQSGGSIQVRSKPGEGSTLTILLPVYEMGAPSEYEVARKPHAASGLYHVLLVEDDELIRTLEIDILAASGMVVRQAADGLAALNLLLASPEEFDLVVVDVVMPKLSGVEFAQRALAIRPDLRVLFVSGYAEDQVQLEAFPAGAAAFLQKPFNPVALTGAIATLLAGRTYQKRKAGLPI